MRIESFQINVAFSRLVIAGTAQVAVAVLRALARLCAFVGQSKAYTSLKTTARKFKALYVTHPLTYFSSAPFPVLTRAINIAKRQVISRDEDIKATHIMRQHFFAMNPSKDSETLKTYVIKGAKSSGICYGATRTFIKRCLTNDISSEDELKKIAMQFEDGFDAEAAAIQIIYKKAKDLLQAEINRVEKEYNEIKQNLNRQIDSLKEAPSIDKVREGIERLESIRRSSSEVTARNKSVAIDYHNTISKLIDIEITSSQKYLLEDEEDVKAFTNEPFGLYTLSFATKSNAHVVAYLKYPFGEYLFDPNYGLMPIPSESSAKAILTLQKFYKPEKLSTVTSYTYKLCAT